MMVSSARFVFLFSILAVALFLQGCGVEGCTDEQALNYNSVANKDDGSCLYCNSGISEGDLQLDIRDDNSFSQFYNQVVARAHLHRKQHDFLMESCGTDTCRVYYQIQNLTNRRIAFSYNFIFGSSSSIFQFVDIPAGQYNEADSAITTPGSSFNNICNHIEEGNVFLELNSNIDYF